MEEGYVIYADILILINLLMDFLCLYISARLSGKAARFSRLFAASVLGGVYSLFYYAAYPLPSGLLLLCNLLAAAIICFVAFKVYSVKDFFKTYILFFLTSALLGGLLSAVYGVSGRFSEGIYTELSPLSLVAYGGAAAGVAYVYSLLCKQKISVKSMKVQLFIGGEDESDAVKVELLVDSGNLAREPFSNLPVILVLARCLPPPLDNPDPQQCPFPLRYIPIKTALKSDLLPGFIPKKVVLKPFFKKERVVEAAVAIDFSPAHDNTDKTGNNAYAGYDGVLPAVLLD